MGYSSTQRSVFFAVLAAVAAGTAFATVGVAGVSQRGPSRGDPVVFLKGVVRQIAGNQYARVWESLAPAQKRLVPKGEYVRCESASPIPGRLTSLKVVRTL